MITLKEYKKHLTDFYVYAIDSTKEKEIQRKEVLKKFYGDSILKKVIHDTYDFVQEMFEEGAESLLYYRKELTDFVSRNISLNVSGGWPADVIYLCEDGRSVSRYILRHILGDQIQFDSDCEVEEFEDDLLPDLIGVQYHYYLVLQNFPENMLDIKKQICKNTKIYQKKIES